MIIKGLSHAFGLNASAIYNTAPEIKTYLCKRMWSLQRWCASVSIFEVVILSYFPASCH